jgi:hypothetical protein
MNRAAWFEATPNKENVMRSIGTLFCLVVLGTAGCTELDSTDSAQEETASQTDVAGADGEQAVANEATNGSTISDEAFAAGGELVKEDGEKPLTADAPAANFVELQWNILGHWSHRYFGCQIGSGGSALRLNQSPFEVGNGCTHRVWLFQWNNRTGYRTCVSPHTYQHLGRAYKSFAVGTSGAHC